MNYQIARKEITHYEATGDCTGDWVSESRYAYKLRNPEPGGRAYIFESHSRVNLEFAMGGSLEAIVTVMFIVPMNQAKPFLMETILLAKESFKIAKEEFYRHSQVSGNKDAVWLYIDDDKLADILSGELSATFP